MDQIPPGSDDNAIACPEHDPIKELGDIIAALQPKDAKQLASYLEQETK